MRKSLLVVGAPAAVAVAVFASVVGTPVDPVGIVHAQKAGETKTGVRSGAQSIPVETIVARAVRSAPSIRAVGSLQSDETVMIAPEVAGRLSQIAFREGEAVKAGDVLIRLDDALARGELAESEAAYNLAKANHERANALAKTGNVTERSRDEAIAAFESAKAAVELARVRLDKHSLRAPFDGVVGLRKASVGAYITIGAPLVNLEKIDALKVDFKVPERFLGDVSINQSIEVVLDALPNRKFTGTIYAIDPMVDVNGRALQIRARLENPNRLLRPGLFARITIQEPEEQTVLLIPESAIIPRGSDSFVYRVENGRAIESKVKLGERKAGQVEIIDGLAPEATVVTAGQQRLRDGAAVEVVSSETRARG